MIVFGVLLWLAAGTVLNVLVFPTVRRSGAREPRRDAPDAPMVSVLVPARNEERNIHALASGLMVQNDPNFEVLVLDDHSTDRTAEILDHLGFADATLAPAAQFRRYSGRDLPDGWTGKAWACHQLAGQARGDWLLFTDADTIHHPDSVRAAVESAQRLHAGLLSAWPRQITGTWSEKLVIPLLYVLTHTLLPQALVRLFTRIPRLARLAGPTALSSLGAANGQFLLFRRETYHRIGGHEAVRSHLVEDVALGRAVIRRTGQGEVLINADGSPWVSCRMYRGFREVWEGFSKNLRPVFGGNGLAFVASGLVQFAVFIAPFFFALLPWPGQAWAVAQVCLLAGIRLVLVLRFRTSWLGALAHPFAHLLALAIAINSWRWSARGKILWKGREYAG